MRDCFFFSPHNYSVPYSIIKPDLCIPQLLKESFILYTRSCAIGCNELRISWGKITLFNSYWLLGNNILAAGGHRRGQSLKKHNKNSAQCHNNLKGRKTWPQFFNQTSAKVSPCHQDSALNFYRPFWSLTLCNWYLHSSYFIATYLFIFLNDYWRIIPFHHIW